MVATGPTGPALREQRCRPSWELIVADLLFVVLTVACFAVLAAVVAAVARL